MQFIQHKTLAQKIAGIWIISLTGVWVLGAYLNVFEAPRSLLETITALNWIVLSIILYITLPKGMWSICFIFLAVVGVFHIGLVLANSLNGITDEDILYQISRWFYSVETDNAIHVVNLAMIGFSLSAILFSTNAGQVSDRHSNNLAYRKRLFNLGGVLLGVFVLIFFAITVITGAISSYGAYLEVMSTNPLYSLIFSYLYFFIGIAFVFVCVSYAPGFGYLYFGLFAVWALFAFKIGLRGEVMFPSAVAACMLGRKGAPIRGWLLAVLVILFLIITGIVKNARVSGDYGGNDLGLNPLNAVAEMGSSLRAVQETIKWRKNDNFQLLVGASYWAPVERQLALFIPQLERIDVENDGRLLNIVVQKKAGPIGFSAIAEAYINFGEKGVIVVFFVIGWIMARLDSSATTIRNDILIGVALLPIFVTIRNSFIHVPVQLILGLSFATLLMYLAYKKSDQIMQIEPTGS